jgi:hypothetical protein
MLSEGRNNEVFATRRLRGAYSTAGILGKRDALEATAKAAEALIDAAIA